MNSFPSEYNCHSVWMWWITRAQGFIPYNCHLWRELISNGFELFSAISQNDSVSFRIQVPLRLNPRHDVGVHSKWFRFYLNTIATSCLKRRYKANKEYIEGNWNCIKMQNSLPLGPPKPPTGTSKASHKYHESLFIPAYGILPFYQSHGLDKNSGFKVYYIIKISPHRGFKNRDLA